MYMAYLWLKIVTLLPRHSNYMQVTGPKGRF